MLHEWFGLSYASYLTMPRSVLQSLPDDLQGRLAAVLQEICELTRTKGLDWPGENTKIEVRLRRDGKFVRDDLADYERGRRRLFE